MNDYNKTINKINNALNANDLEKARKLIENDLKRLNAKSEYYFYLALISDDKHEKLELYTKAIEYNENYLDAYINRGLVNNELQNFEQSINDYNKAIEIDSKCALAFNNRGYTYFKQKKYEYALKDYNKAILLNPKFQMAIDNKTNLFNKVCLKDDENFSEKYYLSSGIQNINLKEFPEAINNLNEVLKYNKKSDLAMFYLGIAYHNLGNIEKANEYYTNTININKNMIDAYFNRGQLFIKTKPKQALDDFVSAVALDKNFIDAYYYIATIQKQLGQYKDAIANLDKIIELDSQSVNAKALKKLILTKYLKN